MTTFGIAVNLGRRPGEVAQQIERRVPGAVAVTEPGEVVKVDTSSRLIIDTGWIFSFVALIVGGIGVTNTMAMSVIERTREIGIMRAVGWPSWRIALLIFSEAIGIGLIALAFGLLVRLGRGRSSSPRGGALSAARPSPTSRPRSSRGDSRSPSGSD